MRRNWKIIFGLVAIIAMASYFMTGDKFESLVKDVEQGSPFLLFAALAFQTCKYLLQAESFVWCFKAVGAKLPYKANVSLVFKTFFMDTVIPSMNISGTSVVIEGAERHGIADGRSTGAALLRQISISAAFELLMLVGFISLFAMGKLEWGYILIGILTTLGIGAMVGGMVLAALKPGWVLKAAKPIERPLDKILAYFHKKPVDEPLEHLVDTYSASAKLMASNKRDILAEYSFAALANVMELACFALICAAFNVADIHIAICVYVLATVASLTSPIPQGVGVVEAASLVAFALFSVSSATGMAIIMVYRFVSFWIPFLLGAVLMQRKP